MSLQDGSRGHPNAPAGGILFSQGLLRPPQQVPRLGLHRIRPGMNKDPQYENNIQALACQRFRVANHRKFDEDDNNDEEDNDPTQSREITLDGIYRRKMYNHKNYGGPRPEVPRSRRGCGRGGAGIARGRGCGRGQGQVSVPNSATPASTPRAGVKRVDRSPSRGRGRGRAT